MLYLKNSKALFFHIPKTGGTFISQLLKELNIDYEELLFNGNPHDDYETITKDWLEKIKFYFCFVRHPLTFYKSYYSYRQKTGWESGWWLDKNCYADNFEDFIKNIVKINYPYLTNLYKKYNIDNMNFIGKFENLRYDLAKVLTVLKEKWDCDRLFNYPKVNESDSEKLYCSEELENKLLNLEKEIINKWYKN